MIEKGGCSKQYYELEECLGEYDRNWSKCQEVVKTLRMCNDKQNREKRKSGAEELSN